MRKLEQTRQFLEQRNEAQDKEIELHKIESGVPIPHAKGGVGLRALIEGMKIGDSFATDQPTSSLYVISKRHGFKVSTRRIHGTKLLRVWRVQ